MQQKSIWIVLSVTVLCVVTSLLLVFFVGPVVNADTSVNLNSHSHFTYADDAETIINGLSATGKNFAAGAAEIHVTIPYGVVGVVGSSYTSIFGNANDVYKNKVTAITLPSTLRTIGDFAFWNCTNLASLNLAQSQVATIGANALGGTAFTEITMPASLTSVGDYAFYLCTNLVSLDLSQTAVTQIGDYALAGCSALHSLQLPQSLTTIGAGAFAMTGLTEIRIPKNVVHIGEDIFMGTAIEKIIVENAALLDEANLRQYTDQMEVAQDVDEPDDPNSDDDNKGGDDDDDDENKDNPDNPDDPNGGDNGNKDDDDNQDDPKDPTDPQDPTTPDNPTNPDDDNNGDDNTGDADTTDADDEKNTLGATLGTTVGAATGVAGVTVVSAVIGMIISQRRKQK